MVICVVILGGILQQYVAVRVLHLGRCAAHTCAPGSCRTSLGFEFLLRCGYPSPGACIPARQSLLDRAVLTTLRGARELKDS